MAVLLGRTSVHIDYGSAMTACNLDIDRIVQHFTHGRPASPPARDCGNRKGKVCIYIYIPSEGTHFLRSLERATIGSIGLFLSYSVLYGSFVSLPPDTVSFASVIIPSRAHSRALNLVADLSSPSSSYLATIARKTAAPSRLWRIERGYQGMVRTVKIGGMFVLRPGRLFIASSY